MPSTDVVRLHIKGFSQPVDFLDCPALATGIASILRGWEVKQIPYSETEDPLITFQKKGKYYDWIAPWVGKSQLDKKKPPKTVVNAICDFHYEFTDWYVAEHPEHFCLHCAAVKIGGGLVVFPNIQKAGKSILTVQLAADGQIIFGDDVLAINPHENRGIALGMIPRVRLPLPDTLDDRVKEFVTSRCGPTSHHYQYVALKDTEFAPYRTSLPIHGVIMLNRQEDGPAALEPESHGKALKSVISRNFVRDIPSLKIFDQLRDIVTQTRAFTLTYSSAAEASNLLRQEFDDGVQRPAAK